VAISLIATDEQAPNDSNVTASRPDFIDFIFCSYLPA
jgi:hypothetical protein